MRKLKKTAMLIFLATILVGTAFADKLEIQSKLSKSVKLSLKDVTIVEALGQLGDKLKIDIELSDQAVWKLPSGEATRLSVTLQGPASASLTEMLNAFFMRYSVGPENITIYPRDELKHIIGRPSTRQFELLRAIYTMPTRTYYTDLPQKTVNEALGQEVLIAPMETITQLNALLSELAGIGFKIATRSRGRVTYHTTRDKSVELLPSYQLHTPVTLAQLLDQVAINGEPRETTWHIPSINFPGQVPEIRAISYSSYNNLLRVQKIDISYKKEKISKIIDDIKNRGSLYVDFSINADLRGIELSVNMQNVTAGQALKNVLDSAGISYEAKYGYDFYIHGLRKPKSKVETRATPKPRTAASTGSSGYVGKVSIPIDDGAYFIEFMLKECDLSEELKVLRNQKMKEIKGESQKPKTPSTRPSTQKQN